MASTYVNDLRLNELGTGDASGTWGTITNLNLELIGEGLSYGTQDCFTTDADATTTVADGASDPARAMYFKVTSSATLTATRTLTIAPNTVSRLQFIENATTGGQSINISQGSGSNVTIPTGATKAVYLDGAGSTAAVTDAFADLNVGTIDATTLQIGGTSVTATATELNYNDITTLGTVEASKVVTADANGDVLFPDNDIIKLGAGPDLQIYHNGSSSYIDQVGTGTLYLRNTTDDFDVVIQSDDGAGGLATYFGADGSSGQAKMMHYGSLKLNTKSDGVDITGELQCDTLDCDGASDFTGNLTVNNSNIIVTGTGNREISVTSSNGIGSMEIGGSTGAFIDLKTPGSDDFDMRVQGDGGSGGNISIAGGTFTISGGTTLFNAVHSGAVTLYHNGNAKLATTSTGIDVTGTAVTDGLDVGTGSITASDGTVNFTSNINAVGYNFILSDSTASGNNRILLGAGNDLHIYHDGSNSYVNDVGVGQLILASQGNGVYIQKSTTETMAQFLTDGAVELNYDNSKKFETTSSGVSITGDVLGSNGLFGLDGTDYLQFVNNSHIRFITNNSEEFRMEADGDFHADGDVIAFSTTVSDERLKTDIEKIENATDKVSQLNGYTFTYKADGKKSAGVIAQEVEKVLPSAVSEKELPLKTDDGVAYKTVQYDQIIGLLIESIKELKQEINELKGA